MSLSGCQDPAVSYAVYTLRHLSVDKDLENAKISGSINIGVNSNR